MTEPNPAENGHQFHFEVDIQGAHRSADGPYVDEEQPAGLPFRVTVRAWNLRDACLAAAELALGGWTQPDENGPGSSELLDAAAERGHDAMFEGTLAADGIERDLWHNVALAVLDDPRLLPHWARAARGEADNWHRQCRRLDRQNEDLVGRLKVGVWLHAELSWRLEQKQRESRMWHDQVRYWRDAWYDAHARLEAARGRLADADGMELTRVGIEALRAVIDGDQPTALHCSQACGMVYAGTDPIPAGVLPHRRISDGEACPGRFVPATPQEVPGG